MEQGCLRRDNEGRSKAGKILDPANEPHLAAAYPAATGLSKQHCCLALGGGVPAAPISPNPRKIIAGQGTSNHADVAFLTMDEAGFADLRENVEKRSTIEVIRTSIKDLMYT